MLQELYIRNFALIDEIRLVFGQGLNVLTGETGAGKSILLDALGLILGGRASSEMVRQGCDKALVEALFHIEEEQSATELLRNMGIDTEEGTLIIVREVSSSGKTVCRVNGRIVTVQNLRLLGASLVDVAGQHEHHSLLRTEEHLSMLDAYGGQPVLQQRDRTSLLYHSYREAKHKLEKAMMGEQERAQRVDMLRFQLEEIQSLGLKPGEEEHLEDERRRLSHAEKLFTTGTSVYEGLYLGSGRQQSIVESLHKMSSDLEIAAGVDSTLGNVLELVKSSAYQLEEAAHELRSYKDQIEFNPAKLEGIEERIAVLNRLRRKYGESVAEILEYAANITNELDALEHHEENIERLQKELHELERKLAAEADKLSRLRKKIADKLTAEIVEQLASLMMPKTRFRIDFKTLTNEQGILIGDERVHVTATGVDRVEFLFSPNAGEPLRPLAKIASGGELSRTLLALKTILAHEGVQTLIFDEIDTGISGRAAQAVAEKLSHISRSNQVICVTHLPQVACMADSHYMIQKTQKAGKSFTEVQRLESAERIEEMARMLSGAEITETTRKHAAEMLIQANALKIKAD